MGPGTEFTAWPRASRVAPGSHTVSEASSNPEILNLVLRLSPLTCWGLSEVTAHCPSDRPHPGGPGNLALCGGAVAPSPDSEGRKLSASGQPSLPQGSDFLFGPLPHFHGDRGQSKRVSKSLPSGKGSSPPRGVHTPVMTPFPRSADQRHFPSRRPPGRSGERKWGSRPSDTLPRRSRPSATLRHPGGCWSFLSNSSCSFLRCGRNFP